ncbi:dihydropteroate synthase [Pelagibacteraceae bacterium]|jgi:dihydropteroate synthase|nr:dihydropteroate synthase [Pelagibacteraceae bacterium]
MRKYYTRPCNFYYGNYSKHLVKKGKTLPLAGNSNISFDHLEILKRKNIRNTESNIYPISKIKKLTKVIQSVVKKDLKNIVSKRKSVSGIQFNKPHIMGILNMTPDSFSDGGLFFSESKAYHQANLMIKNGASIIDIGGESTRPGSKTINNKREWNRIKNVIKKIKKKSLKIVLSLDTRKSEVMKKGIEYGVDIINDVSGLNFDKKSFDVIKSKNTPFILHHMQGTPDIMQKKPIYKDAILDVYDFFEKKINFCLKKKYTKELIIVDPGIGFGKNLNHNLRIMSKISLLHSLGCPIMIGTSKKRFIEHIVTKFDTPDRTGGTLASVLHGLSHGVQLFRVHNVKEINQGILVFNKILNTN